MFNTRKENQTMKTLFVCAVLTAAACVFAQEKPASESQGAAPSAEKTCCAPDDAACQARPAPKKGCCTSRGKGAPCPCGEASTCGAKESGKPCACPPACKPCAKPGAEKPCACEGECACPKPEGRPFGGNRMGRRPNAEQLQKLPPAKRAEMMRKRAEWMQKEAEKLQKRAAELEAKAAEAGKTAETPTAETK